MSKTAKIVIGALAAIAVIAIVALVAVFLLNRGDSEDPLAGTQWQVRSFYNAAEAGGMASPLSGTQLTAEFAEGKVNGTAGCNT